jgi:hypothetical protein
MMPPNPPKADRPPSAGLIALAQLLAEIFVLEETAKHVAVARDTDPASNGGRRITKRK